MLQTVTEKEEGRRVTEVCMKITNIVYTSWMELELTAQRSLILCAISLPLTHVKRKVKRLYTLLIRPV